MSALWNLSAIETAFATAVKDASKWKTAMEVVAAATGSFRAILLPVPQGKGRSSGSARRDLSSASGMPASTAALTAATSSRRRMSMVDCLHGRRILPITVLCRLPRCSQ